MLLSGNRRGKLIDEECKRVIKNGRKIGNDKMYEFMGM